MYNFNIYPGKSDIIIEKKQNTKIRKSELLNKK